MSDDRAATPDRAYWIDASDDDGDSSPTAGVMLKRAREASGLHIAALAVSLKVPVKKLEALEQDRIDLLPDAMFARALASSVCRSLKLDPVPVLARLPQTSFRASSFHEQRPAVPFQLADRRQRWPVIGRASKPILALGLLFLIGAMVLFYLPGIQSAGLRVVQNVQSRFVSAPSVSEMALPARMTGAAEAADDRTTKGGSLTSSIKTELPAASSDTSSSRLLALAPSATPEANQRVVDTRALSSAVVAIAPVSPTAGAMLTLTASKESWVKVIDGKGTVLLSRLLGPGEVVQASGILPLDAVVGRADVVRAEVRGKWLDLGPLSRDNVARFEVK